MNRTTTTKETTNERDGGGSDLVAGVPSSSWPSGGLRVCCWEVEEEACWPLDEPDDPDCWPAEVVGWPPEESELLLLLELPPGLPVQEEANTWSLEFTHFHQCVRHVPDIICMDIRHGELPTSNLVEGRLYESREATRPTDSDRSSPLRVAPSSSCYKCYCQLQFWIDPFFTFLGRNTSWSLVKVRGGRFWSGSTFRPWQRWKLVITTLL